MFKGSVIDDFNSTENASYSNDWWYGSKSKENNQNNSYWDSISSEPKTYLHILSNFKTHKCANPAIHQSDTDFQKCEFFHSKEDRRRSPFVGSHLLYSNKLWSGLIQSSGCPFQDSWNYAHSIYEVRFHPSNFKTLMCEYESIEFCMLGHSCPKVHLHEDTRSGSPYTCNEETEDTISKSDEVTNFASKPIQRKFSSPIAYDKDQKWMSKQVHTPIKYENNLRYSFNSK